MMIKIKSYFDLPDSERIFNLYLFMVAMSMPFYPEDIFTDGYFSPDGVTKKTLAEFDRPTRRRTAAYQDMLNSVKTIKHSAIKCDRKTEDALLAEELISDYSTELHSFLYDGYTGGHVNPESLRVLLTTPMDKPSIMKNAKLYSVFNSITGKEDTKKILENVFRYDTFSGRQEIYQFISLLGVEICPYCNRLYITVAKKEKSASPIRPELDHYRSKSLYPFFALSIMNLIPSCSVCNRVKSNRDKDKTKLEFPDEYLLYPYSEGIENDYSFRTEPLEGITYLSGARVSEGDFELALYKTNADMDLQKEKRTENTIKILRLNSLYGAQREYVSDLMFQRYIFNDPMIHDLMVQFPDLFKNERDVRNMLLLMDINKNSWGKRPLAKLTHDISLELDELYEAVGVEEQD